MSSLSCGSLVWDFSGASHLLLNRLLGRSTSNFYLRKGFAIGRRTLGEF
jgi:hypothetical protein